MIQMDSQLQTGLQNEHVEILHGPCTAADGSNDALFEDLS